MIVYLIKKLSLFLSALILAFAIAISTMHMLTPTLNKHKQDIEQWLSNLLQEPITIGEVQAGWYYFKPIIALHNIKISPNNNSATHLNYLAIDFNIWRSLINWQLAPKKILLSGTQLKVLQEDDGSITFVGFGNSAASQRIELAPLLQALRIMQLQVKNLKIEVQTKNGMHYPIEVDSISVKNSQDRYRIDGEIQIDNQEHSKIKFNSNIIWKKQGEQWLIQIPFITAKATGLYAEGQGQIISAPQHKTKISFLLNTHIKNVDILKQFLPVNSMQKNLKNWLLTALVQGEDINSKIILDGNIEDFPFKNNKGIFIATNTVRNLNLNYKQGWPSLKDLNGEIVFRNLSMQVAVKTGSIDGAAITNLNANIPNMVVDPRLTVNGELTGTLSQLVNFFQTSPLKRKIGDRLDILQASGPMQLKLQMQIPLDQDQADVIARGDIHTDAGQLNLPSWQIHFNKMQADLHFDNYILSAKNIKTQFLDQPAVINIDTMNTESKSPYYAINLISQTSTKELQNQFHLPTIPYVEGNFSYQASLNLYAKHDKTDNLVINSDLKNVAIDLPKPFGKQKGYAMPSRIEIPLTLNPVQISLHYANDITLDFEYHKTSNHFNLDIISPMLSGEIQILKNKKIIANLRHLYLDDSFSTASIEKTNPTTLPDLDIKVEDLRLGDYNIGKTYINTEKIKDGMQINSLEYDNGRSRLNASGKWTIENNQNTSVLRGHFYTKRMAQTLNDLDITPFMDAKNVNMTFNLSWNDTPLQFDSLHAYGNLIVQTSEGSFPTSGQGNGLNFGRIFTLLSIQSLPRRLTLNFNDLTLQGFSFDSMSGYLTLKNGELKTEDTRLRGIVADVKLHGNVNLLQKQLSLFVHITPHLTSSLPIIATIAGGPVAGVATFFATTLLSSTVDDIASRHYQIQGDWNQPLIKETQA